jgi:hypothetical protein
VSQAAFCSECGENVFVTSAGTCPKGHLAASLSGYYDVPPDASQALPTASAPATKTKPGRTLVIILGVVVLAGCCALASCAGLLGTSSTKSQSSSSTTSDSSTPTAEPAAPSAEPAPPPQPVKEPGFAAGMYKVGADLPAGEYVLLAESDSCYFQVDKDSTGSFESIVCNDNFANRSILTVKAGQYLTVQRARIIPIAEAPKPEPVDGMLPPGMYKVGTDVPPGEYKIVSDGSGYVEVDKNSLHGMESIISNDNFEGEKYVTIKAGQYLKLSRASLRLK